MDFEVLDINCVLGKQINALAIPSADELLSIMDGFGIDEAFVSAPQFSLGTPETGGSSRLYPVFNAIPHHTGECPPPDAMGKCHAVRIYPVFHRVKLHLWLWNDLFSFLCERRLPLFIDFSNRGWQEDFDYDGVHAICDAYPDMPVVIMRASVSADRYLYRLWDIHQNLYILTLRTISPITDSTRSRRGFPQGCCSSGPGCRS